MYEVKDYYNKTATEWSELWFNEKHKLPIIKKYIKQIDKPNPKILDMGCGAGYESRMLREEGAVVTGIDISEKLIDIASRSVEKVNFVCCDMLQSMKKLGKFDAVFCLACLIHVGMSEVPICFKNIAEVLNDDGYLLISVKDGVGKDVEKSYTMIDGESYDKNFNKHNSVEIITFSKELFDYLGEWRFEDYAFGWRYYLLKKRTIKNDQKDSKTK